ncbi:fungal zn(2)-Cys(6) binuclear cluster domain-containing protein [Sarocladium implicatum]|nr:fungal zn(2)-Cys(6) binuclear cluster domain-containing protein [Sarocladium implicatum]
MTQTYHTGQWRIKSFSDEPQTCLQCRHRKVRCDKRPGTCRNCERLDLECNPKDLQRDESIETPNKNAGNVSLNTQPASTRRLRGVRACSACRAKKTKCTGEYPTCVTCQERGRKCTYPALKRYACSSGSSASNDAGGELSQSIMTASEDCETLDDMDMDQTAESLLQLSNSVHVVTGTPGETHQPADMTLNIESSLYNDPQAPSPSHETASGQDRPSYSQSYSSNQLEALVDVFFESVYPMPSYAFLHPATTRRRCRSRHTHRALSSAVCAIAALYLRVTGRSIARRFPSDLSVSAEQAASWIQMTEQSVWMNLESPSIPRLQALLLVIHYHMETGRFQRAFMLTATADRFAAALRLNHERHDLPAVSREVRRRILWSLKIVERYFSVGLPEFDLLPLEVIYIDYPHSEAEFIESGCIDNQSGDDKGAYRLIVQLEAVRRDIMKLSRNISILETPLSSLAELINHHHQALAAVGTPPALQNSDMASTLDGASVDRWLPRLLLAHVSWHQAHCDLYRILLPGYSEAAPSTVLEGYDQDALAAAETQCLYHATRMIHLLTALNQHSLRHHLLEFDTAICAYHATRLLLFISRFGKGLDRPSPEFAASRAELCLAALKRFFLSSALVGPIIRELEHSIAVFSEQQRQSHQVSAHALSKPGSAGSRSTDASPATDAGTTTFLQREHGSNHSAIETGAIGSRGGEGAQLTAAARTRQRLAIHSLLRRADFPDNENDEDSDENPQLERHETGMHVSLSPGVARSLPVSSPVARHGLNQNPDSAWRQAGLNGATTQSQRQATRDVESIPSSRLQRQSGGHKGASNGSTTRQARESIGITAVPDTTPRNLAPATQSFLGSSNSPNAWLSQDQQDLPSPEGLPGRDNTTQSMFSWWAPHDWGWLFDATGNPV